MKLSSLKKALSVKPSLARYNKRYKAKILERDLYVIYIIKKQEYPINRLKILTLLSKTHHSMNYQQLNCSISLLIGQGFVKRYDNKKSKRFSITPSGIEFLCT